MSDYEELLRINEQIHAMNRTLVARSVDAEMEVKRAHRENKELREANRRLTRPEPVLTPAQVAAYKQHENKTGNELFVISEDIGHCEPDVRVRATTNSNVVAGMAAYAGYTVTTELPHFTTTNQFIQWAEAR